MEIEDALFRWVKLQTPVTSFIGTPPNAVRFYKLQIPKGSKMPACVVQRSGAARQYLACAVDGAVPVSLQIDHYATTWAEMAALAKAFFRALNPNPLPFPLVMGSGDSPEEGVKVKAAMLENEFDLDDPEPGLLRRTQLWTFWVAEV